MSNSGEGGIGYWLRWQVPVCALIFIAPSVAAFYIIKKVKAEPLYHDELWKPSWRWVHPLWLLFFRLFAFIFLASVLYQVVALEGAFAFYFYTQWTFALVMVYFALGTIISAYGCWVSSRQPDTRNGETDQFFKRNVEDNETAISLDYRGAEIKGSTKPHTRYNEEGLRQRAGFWGYLMQTIYQTCAGAAILTDIVFWCILLPFLSNAHFGLNILMGGMHSLNAGFLILDTILNSLPFPWFRLAYFVQWSCLYIVFQWIIHACGFTWWPYPFLELKSPWAPLWYISLAVVHIPCYGLYALIVKAKYSILPKWFPQAFVRSY